MRVVSQNAKGMFVDGRRMISIPLPPRRRPYLSPAKRALKKFKEIVTFDREAQVENGAENHQQHRRKTMRRALGVSILLNLLVALVLYLVVYDSGEDLGGEEGLITVRQLVTEKSATSSSSQEKSKSAAAKSEQKMEAASSIVQQKNLSLIAAISQVPEVEMSSIELSTFEFTTDPSLSGFGPSMTHKDLQKRKVRPSDPFGKNGKPAGFNASGDDVFGAMPNDVNGFFEGKTVGDGSDLILFLDVSGSMKERSEAVGRYVEINYPKASIVEVQGCNFRGEAPSLFRPMLNSTEMKIRSQLVFVCDLQDGVDQNGIDAIGHFVLQDGNRKSFHVISFNKSPHELLLSLIERSNGSFKKAH